MKMKFSDIEQFIRSGGYEIDVSLNHLQRTLDDWKEDYGLELNPDFQRGHVWNESQQIAFIEFLLKGGVTSKVIYFNSPAFGGRSHSGNLDDTILCVDGLQRLTACLRFMNNEIKAFNCYFKEFEGTPRMMQGLRFNVNSLENREDVLKWYIQFNDGGTIHTKEEIDRVKALLKEEQSR
jgi:uncharacterized protein with ParB-like and HNH nuclease domain